MVIKSISNEIVEEVNTITQEELERTINSDLSQNELFELIKNKIDAFLEKVKAYESQKPNQFFTIGQKLRDLENQKEFIYNDFFEIQNLINLYFGQKIVITYVYVDENGNREIRTYDNTVQHLAINQGFTWNNNPFYKLGYNFDNHYKKLLNALPPDENQYLSNVAKEVENRYIQFKKRVLWFVNNKWKGYQFYTKGPINEAFVNFYVHNEKLRQGLENGIDDFMLNPNYGAILADATKGFLIGDVSKNNVQYAVKGVFSSPQGVSEIIKEFKKLSQDFTKENLEKFKIKFKDEEQEKQYKSQIKELSDRSISGLIRYHSEELEKIYSKIII